MCRPVFMQTPESSPGGAAVSRGGRRARCRPPPRLGPQVRWAAGRPGPLSGRPSLGCSAAPGRRPLRPRPRSPRAALALRRLRSPRPAAHLPARPAGRPFAGLRRRAGWRTGRGPGRAGRLGGRACPPASQGAPASAVGARGAKPLRPARRPLAAGRARAGALCRRRGPAALTRTGSSALRGRPPAGAAVGERSQPPSSGARRARPRRGAPLRGPREQRPAAPPAGRAGRGGLLGLVAPRRLGTRSPEGLRAGRRLPGPRPANTLRGLARVPPPRAGGLGTREEDRSAFREAGAAARSCGWPEACSPRPWDSGCLGCPRPESGELCSREALLELGGGVGTPSLCETAQEGPGKAFPESGSHSERRLRGTADVQLGLDFLACLSGSRGCSRAPAPPDLRRPGVPPPSPLL